MPKYTAESLSTAELLRLEVEYRDPQTMERALVLRGVEAELLERNQSRLEPDLKQRIEELEGELDDARRGQDETAAELTEMHEEAEILRNKLQDAETELSELRAEVKKLRANEAAHIG